MHRGEDHERAVSLLERALPEGRLVRSDFQRLLSIKDRVHYQAIMVTPTEATAAIRQARRMLLAAEEALASS
jgi:hypothetical protein